MKLARVATLLLIAMPWLGAAQSTSAADPETAVASAVADSLGPGKVAFDTRIGGGATHRTRSVERANAIAKLLHADPRRGDSVLVCATDPRSCSLGAYTTLVSMSEPILARNGRSARITVTMHWTTNIPRIPVAARDVDCTVARAGTTWRVVECRTTRVT
jgi:hypothetical protein